jgi:hypothetical protein
VNTLSSIVKTALGVDRAAPDVVAGRRRHVAREGHAVQVQRGPVRRVLVRQADGAPEIGGPAVAEGQAAERDRDGLELERGLEQARRAASVEGHLLAGPVDGRGVGQGLRRRDGDDDRGAAVEGHRAPAREPGHERRLGAALRRAVADHAGGVEGPRAGRQREERRPQALPEGSHPAHDVRTGPPVL